jgi:hypothetical protein
VLEPVSVGLKFGFLIILYLFLFWVAATALFDVRHGFGRRRGAATPPPPPDATGMYAAAAPLIDMDEDFEPRLVVARAPGHDSGVAYDLTEGATLGRGEVEIQLDDPFASSQHARISRQGRTLVLEDLGSTNGTYLNDEPVTGPQPLHDEDRIRIGDSEFVYRK